MQTIDITGIIDSWGYTTSEVRYYLQKFAGQPVILRLNSFGGDVNEALAISQALADHGDVTVQLLGFNASAATWLIYGARRVEMADDGFWLCHRSTITIDIYRDYNKTDIDQLIDQLRSQSKSSEAIDLMIARKYLEHAQANGISSTIEDIIELMNEERWLPAAEAHARGFVDAIIRNAKSVSDDTYNLVSNSAESLSLPPLPQRQRKETLIDKARRIFGFSPDTKGVGEPGGNPTGEPGGASCSAQTTGEARSEITTVNTEPIYPINPMNEQFKTVAALLKAENLQSADDGGVTLTGDQLQTIENRINELQTQLQAAEQTVNETTALLDGMSDNVKAIDGLKNKVRALLSVLNRTPAAAPAGNTVHEDDPEQKRLESIRQHAVDPINQEAAAYRR